MIPLFGPLAVTFALSSVTAPPAPQMLPTPAARQADRKKAALITQCNQLRAELNKLVRDMTDMEAKASRLQAEIERMIKLLEQRDRQKAVSAK
jgi:hypothetical protein